MECEHLETNEIGECLDCGVTIQQLMNSSLSTKRNAQAVSILKDLEPLDFPEVVKHRANDIFQQMKTTTNRNNRRKMLLFVCVYYAYRELGMVQVPRDIAARIGIKPESISKALTMFSEINTGYKPVSVQLTPLDYLHNYCESLGIVEELENTIRNVGQRLLESDKSLQQCVPYHVTIALIYYTLKQCGYQIDSDKFGVETKISVATLTRFQTRFQEIDTQ